jgi:hypothetical protein
VTSSRSRSRQREHLSSPRGTQSESERCRLFVAQGYGSLWARDTLLALTPYLPPTRYQNYLEADAVDPAALAYGPNLDRLREFKSK